MTDHTPEPPLNSLQNRQGVNLTPGDAAPAEPYARRNDIFVAATIDIHSMIMARIESMLYRIVCNQDGRDVPDPEWRAGLTQERTAGEWTWLRHGKKLVTFYAPDENIVTTQRDLIGVTTAFPYKIWVDRK